MPKQEVFIYHTDLNSTGIKKKANEKLNEMPQEEPLIVGVLGHFNKQVRTPINAYVSAENPLAKGQIPHIPNVTIVPLTDAKMAASYARNGMDVFVEESMKEPYEKALEAATPTHEYDHEGNIRTPEDELDPHGDIDLAEALVSKIEHVHNKYFKRPLFSKEPEQEEATDGDDQNTIYFSTEKKNEEGEVGVSDVVNAVDTRLLELLQEKGYADKPFVPLIVKKRQLLQEKHARSRLPKILKDFFYGQR